VRNKILITVFVFCLAVTNAFADTDDYRDRELRVVTYNMYLGTDFTEIFTAQSFPEVVSEVAEAYGDVQASDPTARIDEIADQIASSNALVVGLQEVALWRTGNFNDPAPAESVSYDFLEILLAELDERGVHFEAASIQMNFDAELPAAGTAIVADVRYTDRDVILVRSDAKTSEIKIEGIDGGTFDTLLTLPTVIGPVTVPRGWTSVDVKMRGKTFRFINAHTEAFHPLVQYAQAGELMQGLANTDLPVILVGDFNSDAESGGASYQLFVSSGFADSWDSAHPLDAGYTWPLFLVSPDLFTSPAERLDLVMTRGEIDTSNADVIGEDPVSDITTNGLRASDHAGVRADLVLKP